jgi:hypothetical protein
MKKESLIVLAVLLFAYNNLAAQVWTTMAENVIPTNFRAWSLKIAEDSSLWAISTYDAFTPPTTQLPRVHRSLDGVAWSTFTFPDDGGQVGQDISAIDKLNAFVGIGNRLYKTTNGGTHWQEWMLTDLLSLVCIFSIKTTVGFML